jgi:hypothetical protein
MAWSLVANVPPGVVAGTIPVAVFTTTVGLEAFACSAVVAGVATVACNGTTTGNALQGSTVTVVFAPGVTSTGIITGAGPVVPTPTPVRFIPPVPALPPVLPSALVPPPPPPLLPPPPPPSLGQPLMGPMAPGAFPEVPVIPEADSLPLLLGGLAALGGLVAYRHFRRRADDA